MALNRCSLNLKNLSRLPAVISCRSASNQTPAPVAPTSAATSKDNFVDIKTHTGQTFDKNDYRLPRFVGKEKKVNPRWAINLIAEVPPKAVEGRQVMCDGGGGPLGHPNVFINLDEPGNHSCGYCGLRFYQDHKHHH